MASSSSSSSNSPCAACKFLRRKCTQTCVFAPYFPPDQPAKFANVHRVFGASNVSKLLNELPTIHREDAVNSLAYEAEARLRDPVYGCVGCISSLQSKLRKLQEDLVNARKELASYIGAATMAPPFLGQAPPAAIMNHHQAHQSQQLIHPAFHGAAMAPGAMMPPPMGVALPNTAQQPHMMTREQLFETMQLVNAAREQELFSGYEQQNPQNQLEFARYAGGSGYDGGDSGGEGSGFNHLVSTGVLTVAAPSSELALVRQAFDNSFQVQQQQQQHHHHHQQQQQQQEEEQEQQRHHHHQRTRSDQGRSSTGSVMGPSC